MIERKTISYSDRRVCDTVKELNAKGKNVSRFFEDAAIYYLESIEEERISRETVKDIVLDALKGMVVAGPISNPNYVDTKEQLVDSVMQIIGMEE